MLPSGAEIVHVVIDGMNVALANVPKFATAPEKRAKALEGLELCVAFCRSAGLPFKIFVPRGFLDAYPELEQLGLCFPTPGGLDDSFMIGHADLHGSFIISNDRFQDHAAQRGYDQKWLDYHRVPFMFDPNFAPDPDAIMRMKAPVPEWAGRGKARIVTTPPPPPQRTPSRHHHLQQQQQQRQRVHDEDVIQIPRTLVGRLIGKGGSTIHAIEEDHDVRVHVDKESGGGGISTANVWIKAPDKEKRERAMETIRALIDDGPSGSSGSSSSSSRPAAEGDRDEMDTTDDDYSTEQRGGGKVLYIGS